MDEKKYKKSMAVCNNLGHVATQRGKIKHAKVVSWCGDTVIKIEIGWKNHGSDELLRDIQAAIKMCSYITISVSLPLDFLTVIAVNQQNLHRNIFLNVSSLA